LSGTVSRIGLAMVFLAVITGCSHTYVWTEFPVKEGLTLSEEKLANVGTVSIISVNANDDKRDIGNVGIHHYYASHQQLTDSIVAQLTHELEKRNVTVKSGASKSLEVKVTSNKLAHGMWVIRAYMVVSVQMGSDVTREFNISYKTGGTVPHAYDGATTIAVTEILNDGEILKYLQN